MLRSNIVICRVAQQSAQSTQPTQLTFLTNPRGYDFFFFFSELGGFNY